MKDVIFGLLATLIGLLLCFWGYRLARIILPIWGLFAGFTIGASTASDALGKHFIGTSMGFIVGLIIGLIFAIFAYFFYSLAIVLAGASIGYWIGTSFLAFLGLHWGFVSAIVGIIIGGIFAIIAISINAPKYFLMLITAIGGSVAVVGGLLLVFKKIPLNSFNYSATSTVIVTSWWWTGFVILIFLVAIIYQLKKYSTFKLNEWGSIK